MGLKVPRPAGPSRSVEAASQIQYPIHSSLFSSPFMGGAAGFITCTWEAVLKNRKLLLFVTGSPGKLKKKKGHTQEHLPAWRLPMCSQWFQGIENNLIRGQTLEGKSQ